MINILNLLAGTSQSRFISSKKIITICKQSEVFANKGQCIHIEFYVMVKLMLEFERTPRISQIQILGMIWIEEILIQQVCYITHPCLLLCLDNSEHCFRTNCNVEFC